MKKSLLSVLVLLAFQLLNAQLNIYSNLNLQGTSATCVARTVYTGSSIPNGLDNSIKSILLTQGFMATLAENEDGSGERFTYMATQSNIRVNLAFVLQNKVSFIRVLKLPTTPIKKKGSANTNNAYTADLNVSWFYDWSPFDFSTSTREFVPMTWGTNHASDANVANITAKDSVTYCLSFNEPDNSGQANMYVANAIPMYKKVLKTGLRMGSPACTESQYRVWLDSFTNVANAQNLKIDFVAVHWYDWGNWLATLNANPSATDVFNRFKSYIANVYDLYKKPIWITEFNAKPNRPNSVQQAFMQLALPWLDSDPRVERYAYFFGNDVPMYNTNGTLTTSATTYANHASVNAYPANVIDTRPATPILLAGWDPSIFLQGGNTVLNFAPTTLDVNLTSPSGLVRGSGVTLPGTTVSNGYWGGTNWSTSTYDNAVSTNKFITFSLKSKNSKSVNYHSIDKFNIRINNIGPIQYQIEYQLDGGDFSPIALVTGPTRTTGNYLLGPIDLSEISGLQNVAPTSTITFRITPFDASGNGTFLIGSGTADTDPDLTITGGYSDDNIIPTSLPVGLNNFQLKRNNNKVLLSWETIQEINFSHFELERSDNLNTFYPIATVNSNNEPAGSKYSYSDLPTAANTKYYRLKIVDKDGSFIYSNVLSTTFTGNTNGLLVYPNITKGETIKTTFDKVSKNAQLKVFTVTGQLVASYPLQEDATNLNIETANFNKGVYYIVLQNKGTLQTQKIIKQ